MDYYVDDKMVEWVTVQVCNWVVGENGYCWMGEWISWLVAGGVGGGENGGGVFIICSKNEINWSSDQSIELTGRLCISCTG